MKIRTGFVSNSSSSSFILALPRKPESVEELHDWMFPGGETTVSPYGVGFSSRRIVEQVFHDIHGEDSISDEEIKDICTRGSIMGVKYPMYSYPGYDPEKWEQHTQEVNRISISAVNSFLDSYSGNTLIIRVEYSDNDGPFFTTMEHGGIFQDIPHLMVSHH